MHEAKSSCSSFYYQQAQANRSTEDSQRTDVMPDATELLQAKRFKMKLNKK